MMLPRRCFRRRHQYTRELRAVARHAADMLDMPPCHVTLDAIDADAAATLPFCQSCSIDYYTFDDDAAPFRRRLRFSPPSCYGSAPFT